MPHSSSTTGFFQPPPTILPEFPPVPSPLSPLHRILTLYLPHPIPSSLTTSLSNFSTLCLHPSTLSHTVSAELQPPTLQSLTVFGAPNVFTPLKTSEGWRALKAMGQREGTVGLGFELADPSTDAEGGEGETAKGNINPRIHQFIKLAIWQGSAAMVTCPAAMTDGAAVLLGRQLDLSSSSSSSSSSNLDVDMDMSMTQKRTSVFREVRRRLISRDPSEAWTAGQWMTERMGGSDVRGTETVATLLPVVPEGQEEETDSIGLPLGPYSISGFKWFSSATDCDCAVLLAQTRPGSTDIGVSVFLAPMRLADGRLNGVRIQRLKEKMGTKPVPTAEVEIRGMRGWMVGGEGEGIREISSILNVTRLHTGVANVGYWGRGLSVSRGYSLVRRIKGGAGLGGNVQHVAWMAGEEVKYRASLGLVMFGAGLLGVQEQGGGVVEGTFAGDVGLIPRDREDVGLLLRIMTPLLKGQTTLAGTAGLRACMESLGGIGYLENNETPELNLARLFRDSVVSSIWEGTTSVMAEDVMRVLKGKTGKQAMRVLASWVYVVWTACKKVFAEQEHVFKAAWVAFRKMIEEKETDELLFRGREVLERLEGIVCALLLMVDAVQDQDEVAVEVARRWCKARIGSDPLEKAQDWRRVSEMDKKIFLGVDTAAQVSQSKL